MIWFLKRLIKDERRRAESRMETLKNGAYRALQSWPVLPSAQLSGEADRQKDYGKDYTQLLLNCYIHRDQIGEL